MKMSRGAEILSFCSGGFENSVKSRGGGGVKSGCRTKGLIT